MQNIDFKSPRNFYPQDRYITTKNICQRQESVHSGMDILFPANLHRQAASSSNSSYSSFIGDIFEGERKSCLIEGEKPSTFTPSSSLNSFYKC